VASSSAKMKGWVLTAPPDKNALNDSLLSRGFMYFRARAIC
jgi:hypothetical protein